MVKNDTYQVVIVGGGPVGLLLAISLQHAGISCIILEKRATPITHSRSIGIHPVSLEAFKEMGIAETFITEGIQIGEGVAFFNDAKIGTLSFKSCPPPFPFLLTLPQYKTEKILTNHLQKINATVLQRNATVTEIKEYEKHAVIEFNQNEKQKQISARYVIGCDGKNSFVRQTADITFKGKKYKDTYIMGDFTENTSHGNSAAIYICNDGLIESFPLPKNKRRWVVKTDRYIVNVERHNIEMLLKKRINQDLKETENFMLSSFHVQKGFANSMTNNRIILAGDAAHLVSPIGGQGMNLGWVDAQDLAKCLSKIFGNTKCNPQLILENYSKRRIKIARKAARRAEFNMAMGRKVKLPFFRKALLRGVVNTPFCHLMARLFTMRGLRNYIV